jgi:FeS assembly SUF system protein
MNVSQGKGGTRDDLKVVRERANSPSRAPRGKAFYNTPGEHPILMSGTAPPPTPSTTPATPAAPASSWTGAKIGPASAWDTANPKSITEQKILTNLKKIYDPEIPMNIVDLGLIYGFKWNNDTSVTVTMTLTAPGCPVAGILADEVKAAVQAAEGVKEAVVDMVWEPPWTPDRMSDLAKRTFGYV